MKNCDLQPCDAGFCCQHCEYTGPRRTKRNCPARAGVRGLGDVVAIVAKTMGLKKCGGCAKRQAALNRFGSG